MWQMKVVLVVAAVAVPGVALAQVPPSDPSPARSPGFVTLDRQDGTSRAGGDISYLSFDTGSSSGSLTPLRFNLWGQWVDPVSGAGGYANLPISHYSESLGTVSTSATGIGDLEVGGIYVPHITGNVGVILHAGLTLPTGSSSNDGETANLVTLLARLTDYYLLIPEGWSLRLGVSPVLRSGQLFARADLGVDANLSNKNGSKTADSIIRVNAAVGVDLGTAALSLESVNLYDSSTNSTSTGASWINTGAVAGRFFAGSVQPYAAVVFPLDHDSRDFIGGKFNAAITVGVAAPLQ